MNALSVLKERGFVQQCSNEDAIHKALAEPGVVFYAGFDPTADSLHIGSLVPIMAMAHLQRAGHIPIGLIGGGTTLIGDPSGKTEMRKLISPEEIERNGHGILSQLKRYLKLDEGDGMFVNNADWLTGLNYIQFLRDIGRHFKVNEMIRVEAYRQRLERAEGLSFIEFNYQLLQAYDYLVLHDRHACRLQIGGDDQWGNILAGKDLIRRMRSEDVHALTFPLITTARGQKMGKTEAGAIWLDASRTSPYEFYQYWINVDDRDVARFLALFTFLEMEEVSQLGNRTGAELRESKSILAFETTTLAHGKEEAQAAQNQSRILFTQSDGATIDTPSTVMSRDIFVPGINAADLLHKVGLASSKGEARRLIRDGGAYCNNQRITSIDTLITLENFTDERLTLRKGKKNHRTITIT
ncbi:tyrosine--tRNA ligase [bacterium CG10_46_32]|nr:MAG: tyrosine--tRNA ligase [bacterium CG10_46_32]PIR55717.1 MAG: tyrosine--tRNA ligase [Parcubacteria group bacterium CG10_big_fil_rev_8_21_14_0_10_46_32]